ncbi:MULTISPECIES: DUF6376 family protein [Paenibacillus]|uniref:DUF6376 family protein n=1 Tax=Paenibacillus TaxID=44249 RepID=UPI0019168E52|nr:DUF6376 family protein [Paenibacillus sp. EPM92]
MKRYLLLLALVIGILPGCSALNEVNHTLDYINEATSFVNRASGFAEQVPVLAQQALLDPASRTALQQELESMRDGIVRFNGLEVPKVAQDLHKQLVAHNEALMKELTLHLEQMNQNVIDFKALADSPMLQTINKITQTLTSIRELTP